MTGFGKAMLSEFCFEEGYVNLNNGSFGSLPRQVLDATEIMAREAESAPDLFMRRTYLQLLANVRSRVSKFINAEADECVIVPNSTHGINTVLMNIDWKDGDIIVAFTTTYGAVGSTLRAVRDRNPGLSLKIITLIYPMRHVELLQLFEKELAAIPRHDGQTVLCVLDGIVSVPGVIMPWEDMCKICKSYNVLSLVDGAHLIGQVPVDLNAAQPDFWISNCHKWLYSKRGSAILYVPHRNHHMIRVTLPVSIGYVSPDDPPPRLDGSARFIRLFEWTGTIDMIPFLSIDAALNFREAIGGEKKINDYCHNMAVQGGKRLAAVLGTRVLDQTGELTANMTNVLVPVDISEFSGEELGALLSNFNNTLLDKYNCFAGIYFHDRKCWVRCSAQIWIELSDFEYVGKAILEICQAYVNQGLEVPASPDIIMVEEEMEDH
ncbi:PLP-dependent transferase [Calocera cornea HHB12733]|uniref:PLP-dependent transferase n=1 Tax=Calocera cornea HHB12733 TaxID=1353952 RepID=A0A165GD18_9BASI|nr:PLP-dependent transferase [Calocera cornea HHB12733]